MPSNSLHNTSNSVFSKDGFASMVLPSSFGCSLLMLCLWGHLSHRLTRNPATGRKTRSQPWPSISVTRKPWKLWMPGPKSGRGNLGWGPDRHILNWYPEKNYTQYSLKIGPRVILTHFRPLRSWSNALGVLNGASHPRLPHLPELTGIPVRYLWAWPGATWVNQP